MAKPDYATLLGQIAVEKNKETPNTALIEALTEECYVFNYDDLPTEQEKQLFSYVLDGYVEDNPGRDEANTFVSYIGVYFSDEGETT